MATVNMSLDEIITANKKSKSGRQLGKFRADDERKSAASGKGGSFERFTTRVPDGKWKHDKFAELSRPQRGTTGGIGSRVGISTNPNKMVTINLSNLGADVVTADLEELFAPYDPDTVTVHFNENGESLGTGSVHLKKASAVQALDDYKGVALDGKTLKMIVIDGTQAIGSTSIQSRLKFTSPKETRVTKIQRGGVQKKFRGDARKKTSPTSFLDRLADDEEPKRERGGTRPARGGGRGGRDRKAPKSEAELDAELEAYMSKGKAMDL